MLLNFTCKNFKTFKEEAKLSLVPKKGIRTLSYSVLKRKNHKHTVRALPTSVIYGPNAAGKTNLILAMRTLKNIVNRGHLRDLFRNALTSPILLPHFKSLESIPVEFGIEFFNKGDIYNYTIAIQIVSEQLEYDKAYSYKVAFENLYVNKECVFERTGNRINIPQKDKYLKRKNSVTQQTEEISLDRVQENLSETELFLVNGFKNIINLKLVEVFLDWFTHKFDLIYSSHMMHLVPIYNSDDNAEIELEPEIRIALKELGANNHIIYKKTDSSGEPITLSVVDKLGKKYAIPSERIESLGTIRFLNIFPIILNALKNGSVLVVDELDASIHPQIIASIIKLFHNDEININCAQLIFNTQNPVYLNKNLFRKDEIMFVSKDEQTEESELYSMSDFENTDNHKVDDYMKDYLHERYGAIPSIDFSSILSQFIKKEDELETK